MASSAENPKGSFRQVGKEKAFSWSEESGLHITNRVREYEFTPLKQGGAAEPAIPGSKAKVEKKGNATADGAKPVSGAVTAADTMRLGVAEHPVAALSGALALALLQSFVKGRQRTLKRGLSDASGDATKDGTSAGPKLATSPPLPGESHPEVDDTHVAVPEEHASTMDTSASPAPATRRVENAEEWLETGTPRSNRTVSSTGGASLRSFSVDEGQNQRLASHRKEAVLKLRQQLQSRDEMILEMQQQLAAQEHFTRESRAIIVALEKQLKQAVDGGQKLGAENRDLTDEVQKLNEELEAGHGERAKLMDENKRLSETVADLEAEGDRLEERVAELERARKDLDQERDRLRAMVDEQRGSLQQVELERDRMAGALRERTEALSEAKARQTSVANGVKGERTGFLVEEKERLMQELKKAKAETEKRAAQERAASERAEQVEKELDRCQKMLKGKDRLLDGYEKERVHLTAVLQDLEHKVENRTRELEAFQQTAAGAATEDVQSSNDSDGPRTVAGASPSRGEEVDSKPRGARNLHLMKSFDNPLSDMSPDVSPNGAGRPMSVSKPAREYEGRLMDASVYPSPNGVLENRPRRLSVDEHRSFLKPAADPDTSPMRSDVDALARQLSDRFRTVTKRKLETGRLVADLKRHNDLIVDLERKIGKEEELGLGEDDWLNGGVDEEEDSEAKQADGTAQAAILAKKLEQLALQRQMDEKLAEIQNEQTEITLLKSRVAMLAGKAQGAEKVEPLLAQSDVLGAELARKLAFQEQQAAEALAEVQRLSATFQRGSPLFAKAQDELVRKSLSSLDLKPDRISAGQKSANDAYERRNGVANEHSFFGNGLVKRASGNHVGELAGREKHVAPKTNSVAAAPESSDSDEHPQDELARLTVEVERELSQDFAKRMSEHGNGDLTGSQGSGDMDVEEEGEESVGGEKEAAKERPAEDEDKKGDAELDSTLAAMLESTLDDMVRMCTPASSQANSPFPNRRF